MTPLTTHLKLVRFQNPITLVLFSKSREYVQITKHVSIEDNLLKVFSRKVNDLMKLKSRYPHLSQVFFLCQDTKAQRLSWAISPEWSPCYRFPLPKEWQIKALSERSGSECSDHFRRKTIGKGTNAILHIKPVLPHQTELPCCSCFLFVPPCMCTVLWTSQNVDKGSCDSF